MLLDGPECCALTINRERRKEATEMRFLGSEAGHRIYDRIHNQNITDQLNIFPVMGVGIAQWYGDGL
jgi:hypothetical protein